LNNWNLYCGLTLAPSVDDTAPALSVGVVKDVNRTSPVGELGDGAVTFSVVPPLPVVLGGVGTVGESGFDSEQPNANATSDMLKTAYKNLCCMNCS
jgi:hypothetical protein